MPGSSTTPGGNLDLFAGFDVVVRQVLHAQGRELDVVDPQAALVALGKIDHDLRLGEHLHGVGNRRDSLDRVGQVADVVAGDTAENGPPDEHDADGNCQAGHGELGVDPPPTR